MTGFTIPEELRSHTPLGAPIRLWLVHFVPLYANIWLVLGKEIVTSVVKPDNAVVPDTVIGLVVSLNVAPDRV